MDTKFYVLIKGSWSFRDFFAFHGGCILWRLKLRGCVDCPLYNTNYNSQRLCQPPYVQHELYRTIYGDAALLTLNYPAHNYKNKILSFKKLLFLPGHCIFYFGVAKNSIHDLIAWVRRNYSLLVFNNVVC